MLGRLVRVKVRHHETKAFQPFCVPTLLNLRKNAHKHTFSYNFRRLKNSPDAVPWIHTGPQGKVSRFI